MQIVQSSPRQPTAAPTRGAVERDLDSLVLGTQIVASRVLALSPVDAEGDPSVAITVYARRVFAHEVCVHHLTQTTAVHRQGTCAPKHYARMAGSVTPPTGED